METVNLLSTTHKVRTKLNEIQKEYETNSEFKKSHIARFTAEALKSANPFDTNKLQMESEIKQCIEWRKNMSNKDAAAYIEAAVAKIELKAKVITNTSI